MRYRVRILTIIPALALLFFASCASIEQPLQDPTKEQITLLQKQLLELQKVQIDTKTKLDESTSTVDALTTRLRMLEEKQHIRPSAPAVESAPAETKKIEPVKKQTPVKKKPVKKKAKKKKKPVKKIQPQTQQPQAPQPQAQQPQAQQPQAQQPQAQQPERKQQ